MDGDKDLSIGGVCLTRLAEEQGTPLFVYDVADMRDRFVEARRCFGEGTAYATKAFLCRAVARLARECGLSLDVATEGEYHVCRAAGIPSSALVIHGNNKSQQFIERAVVEGVQWIVLDSFDDLDRVSAAASNRRAKVPVLVRVNPGVEVHTHDFIATGNRRSKFGFPMWNGDAKRAVDIACADRWLDWRGIHTHIGSNVLSVGCYNSALDSMLDFVRAVDPEIFVVGGGLGVRYVTSDLAPTMIEWSRMILGRCRDADIRAQVLAEPGRALVARAGVTLYRVGTTSQKGDSTFVAIDGGMSDNLRPVLYGSEYEAFLPRDPLSERDWVVNIAGVHCESGDILIRDAHIPRSTSSGDVLCVPVTGAYGYSMSSNYNKVPRPGVVFVGSGEYRTVVRRENFEDLLRDDLG